LGRLLDQYERNLISDDEDRRLLNDYRNGTGSGWTG
jgi:hypothetical protein